MEDSETLINDLVDRGIICAGLKALVNDTEIDNELRIIIVASVVATYHASQQAKKLNIPIWVKEGNAIFEIQPDGTKNLVKTLLHTTAVKVPKMFFLK